MKTRKGSRDAAPSVDGEFESWITDLSGGEPTVRKLRKRLQELGERAESSCEMCEGAATGKVYFGLEGHLHERPVSA